MLRVPQHHALWHFRDVIRDLNSISNNKIMRNTSNAHASETKYAYFCINIVSADGHDSYAK